MNEALKQPIPLEGWQDETSRYSESLKEFLATALRREGKDRYDDSTELHFSGNSPRFEDVQRGTALPSSVRVQYKDGKPVQVHAYYLKDERGGQNLDVYITNRALEDFWEKE